GALSMQPGLLGASGRDGVLGRRSAGCGNVQLGWIICNRSRACPSEFVRPAKDIRQIFPPLGPDNLVAAPSLQALADRSRDIRGLLNWCASGEQGGESDDGGDVPHGVPC